MIFSNCWIVICFSVFAKLSEIDLRENVVDQHKGHGGSTYLVVRLTYKSLFLALLALKQPFIRQPDNHLGWANSMPFVSINHIFIEINPWKFGEKQLSILKFENNHISHTDLNKRFLLGPNATTAWKLIPHRSKISKNWNPPHWVPLST